MACNGVLTSPAKVTPPKSVTPPPQSENIPPPPVLKLFTSHLGLKMAAFAFFTHGYF